MSTTRLQLVSGPSVEPVTVAEAKHHLRVEIDDDDALISGYLAAARRLVEANLGISLVTSTWDYYLDAFPYGGGYFNRSIRQMGPDPGNPIWVPGYTQPIDLPRSPLKALVSISYYDASGTLQTWNLADIIVSLGTPGKITPAYNKAWPLVQPRADAVIVRFQAGFGDDATAVPETLKLAIKLLVAGWYENRESAQSQALAEIPFGVKALLDAEWDGTYY